MKISLIIPVYNVEKYLDKCLSSVEKQTYKDTEVIIVNNSSTDNSYKIIEKYVSENSNFTTYEIENNGPGASRNFGISKATGDYIVFLDSDDYVSEDCLEKFADAAKENNSDIVVCNNYDVKEDGTVIRNSINNIESCTTSLSDSPQILLNRPCVWAKMYRRSLFDDLLFVTKEWCGEDLRLTLKMYFKADKITFINDFLFYYVQHEGSIMKNSNASRSLDIATAMDDLISFYKENNVFENYKHELYYLITSHISVAGITRVVTSNEADKKVILRKLHNYISQFDNLYKNKYMNCLDFNKKLILFFNKNKLYFLTKICMMLKEKF